MRAADAWPTASSRSHGPRSSTRAGAAPARSSSCGSPRARRRNYREAIAIVEQSPFPTFQRELLERGILIQPPQEGLFLLSAAHSDDDVELTLERAAEAMPAVALAIAEGRVGPRGAVR